MADKEKTNSVAIDEFLKKYPQVDKQFLLENNFIGAVRVVNAMDELLKA